VVQPLSWRLADALYREAAAISSGMRLVVERVDELVVFTLHVARGARAELMGDFTEWQAVALTRVEAGRYQYVVRLPTGLYRFNIRVDGGSWIVPAGVDVVNDEFGGQAGVLVVP
jgi:hypothetical protein